MLEMAGMVIERDSTPDDPLVKAEGYRYLSRIARAGLEAFVEHADPTAPELRRMIHETVKMGADNPDNHYFNAPITGAHRYRVSGTRGTVHSLSMSTHHGTLGEGAGLPPTGEIVVGRDRERFDITVSIDRPQSGEWLPMTKDSGLLLVRQTFADRTHEVAAEVVISCLDAPAERKPINIDDGLLRAGRMVGGVAAMFANWAEGFAKVANTLPRFDPELSTQSGGDPNIAYYHGYWKLRPDEMLIVEATPPACDYWNFQLGNYWMESLDYRHYQIAVNHHGATLEADGSVKLCVAAHDPGYGNWLDTCGHDQGTMCLRWVRAEAHPEPTTRLVKIA